MSLEDRFYCNVTMLGVMPPSVCSPVLEEPAPFVSSVVMDDVVILEGETNEPSDVVPDVIPPPPDFPPFSCPIARDHVAFEQSGSPLGDGGSPDVLVSETDVEPPFSPIAQDQDSVSVGWPDVGLLVSPLVDISYGFGVGRHSTYVSVADHRQPLRAGKGYNRYTTPQHERALNKE